MDVRLKSCSLVSTSLFLVVWIGTLKGVLPVCIDTEPLTPKLVMLGGSATEVRLECLDLGGYRWWRSNSCETTSFTRYVDVNCNNTQMCAIPLSSLMADFSMYFCCTRNDVYFLANMVPPRCFQIKLCPSITEFVVPPIMFVGSQERVYISVQASPPPPSQHLTIFLESARVPRQLNYTSVQERGLTSSTYVHFFEVPSDVPQGATLTFEAAFNVDSCQQAYMNKMTERILNNSLPSTCAVSSSSALTIPSTTAVMVLPTPSPTPESCPTTTCTSAVNVIAPVVSVTVITAIALCVAAFVAGCVIGHRKKNKYVCSTSNNEDQNSDEDQNSTEDPSRNRPTALQINGTNGVHTTRRSNSPQYATVSNSNLSTPTPYTPNQESRQLVSPPQGHEEEVYGRRHDGNKMTLKNPSQPTSVSFV